VNNLADRIVALGVGFRIDMEPPHSGTAWALYDDEIAFLTEESFESDPRVAMALMERMIAGELSIWRQAYDNDSPVWIVETHLNNADGRDESLSRAINMACVEALSE